MKKLFALCLIVIMLFAFVGCGKEKRQIIKLTLSTEDSEAILAAAGIMLPDAETAAGAGTTVKYFSWYDSFHNYGEDEVINTGYWTFSEKYGSEVEWIECEWSKRFDDLANLVLSSSSPDFYPGESNTFPIRPIKRIFQPVDDYIDYDDPLWSGMKEFVYDYFSIKGRPYIIATDNAFGNICIYNRRVMEEWGFDDPAELYANDEWTWDVFEETCYEFSDPDENRYALDGWYYSPAFMRCTGETIVVYNTETQRYEANVDNPSLERAATLLYDLSKNQTVYPWWSNNWSLRNGVDGGGMKEGELLYYVGGTWLITGPVADISNVWGDVSQGEVMFVPLPRDPQGDGTYYMEANPAGYCIVKGAQNPEGVALLASCDRFKVIDPTVVRIDRRQLEEVYLWNDEMLEMWDTCYELSISGKAIISYNEGLDSKLSSVVSAYENNGHIQDSQTWAQLRETNDERLAYYIDELNQMIDQFDPNVG